MHVKFLFVLLRPGVVLFGGLRLIILSILMILLFLFRKRICARLRLFRWRLNVLMIILLMVILVFGISLLSILIIRLLLLVEYLSLLLVMMRAVRRFRREFLDVCSY